MAKIYRTTDRVKVNIDDVTVKLAPLTLSQKKEIQGHLYKSVTEKDMQAAQDAAILAVKYSLKSIKGLYDQNDEEYQLQMDNNTVSDECIDDLLNIEISDKLALVCTSLLHGINKEIVDPNTNKKIEGISFEESAEKKN